MKFIVSSSLLLKQLTALDGVILANPTVPILENFLFEINDGTLIVKASDLKTSIMTELQVESNEDGSIAIPAKILLETLRNLPEQPVTISVDHETFSIEISSDNGRYKLTGESAMDFPKISTVSDGFSVDVSSEILKQSLNNTIFATSIDDMRLAMTGVYLKFEENYTTFVATDSHRLVRYRREDVVADTSHSMIIPRKALTLLKSTLPNEFTNVNIEFDTSNVFFSFNDVKMICRLIDERYPDYENVIPVDNNNIIVINRMELLSTLKRLAIYANKSSQQIKFNIKGNELVVSAEDLDFSNEATERLLCDHDGKDIELAFNVKFLIEMINNLNSETISLNFGPDPSKAGLLKPSVMEEHEDILMLVMPVVISSQVYRDHY